MTVELWSFSTALGIDPAELRGMSVEARDGGIGRVVDLVDRIGAAHLVVDTGPWIFGKKVMLPAGVITAVDRDEARVFIDRAKDDVKNAPEHDPDAADDLAQRDALTAHYGTQRESVGGLAPAADEPEVPTPPMSFGALDDGPTTPASSTTGEAGQAGIPVTPGVGGTSDADTVQRVDESESPATTGAAWRRPDDTGSEVSDVAASVQPERAPEAPADLTGEQPGRSGHVPPKRRFERDADSAAGVDRRARRSSDAVPIARYESLTAAQVIARLPSLSQRELAEVERYEKRHESRRTVLGRIESLREKEPWRGYDDEKVEQIRKKLADADDERARRVRDYERRHRDRKGVMEAARRAVASA